MSGPPAHDDATLAFYNQEAEAYTSRFAEAAPSRGLTPFLAALSPGARILELGCGGGRDSEAMIAQGFAVTPTDGSAALAAVAERRLGVPVRVMRFDELETEGAYDGVWANACLIHVPEDALPAILIRIRTALRPGGLFSASYKIGSGGARDDLGRYNNLPTLGALEAAYDAAGPWTDRAIETAEGGGYDRIIRTWAQVSVRRP